MDAINSATGVWITTAGQTSQATSKTSLNSGDIEPSSVTIAGGRIPNENPGSQSANGNLAYRLAPNKLSEYTAGAEKLRDVRPLIIDQKSLNSKAAQAFQDIAQFKPRAKLIDTFA